MEVGAGERSTNTKVVAALTKAAADGGELEEAVRYVALYLLHVPGSY